MFRFDAGLKVYLHRPNDGLALVEIGVEIS
jgi:hypothetical protein